MVRVCKMLFENEERKRKEKRLMRGYTERNKELFSPESVRHYNHRAKEKENYRMNEKEKKETVKCVCKAKCDFSRQAFSISPFCTGAKA